MLNMLDNLRKKSDAQKKRIAFSVSFLCAGLIFVVWLTVIFPDFRNQQNEIAQNATTTSPTEGIVSIFSTGFDQISKTFNDLKVAVSSISTSSAYYNSVANPELAEPSYKAKN